MSDEIVLTLPRRRRYYDVAHLVVAGLAARIDLTVDGLADLQLALSGLLPRDGDGEVTVTLRLEDDVLDGRVGPFEAMSMQRELEREGGDGYGTHHVLESVFDSYRLDVEDGTAWLAFTMAVTRGGES